MLHRLFLQAGYLGFWAGSWLGSAGAEEQPSPAAAEAKFVVMADEVDAESEPEVLVLRKLKSAARGAKSSEAAQHVAGKQTKVITVIGKAIGDDEKTITVIGKPLKVDDAQTITVVGKPLGESEDGAQPKVILLKRKGDKPGQQAPLKWIQRDDQPHNVTMTWVANDEEDEPSEEEAVDAAAAEEAAAAEAEVQLEVQATAKLSDYYIGVECYPVEDAVRKQLKLGDKGLWIEGVVDDSPAAKAGFQQNDVIVAADGNDLKEVADLVNAIDKAKDSEIKFTVVREGQRETIKATPAKREEGDVIVNVPEPEDHLRLLEKIRPGQDTSFRFFSPGVVVDDNYEFPENLKISITREGKGPAKVVVERGDDKWTTTSDHLEALPEDVRPHVERMVSGGPMRMMLRGGPERVQGRGEVARAVEGAARRAAEQARHAAQRARARAGEAAEEAGEAGEAAEVSGDRLNRLMSRIEKLFEEKAEMLEKLLEEKAEEVEKRLDEKAQSSESSDEES